MVVWSALASSRSASTHYRCLSAFSRLRIVPHAGLNHAQLCSTNTGGNFNIVPSNFQWKKFKDIFNFYLLLGLIPALGIVMYANIVIGPATLQPIPEGYQPKHWEYHKHPITRFISKYITENPQKPYEKMCHVMFHRQEERYIWRLEAKIKALIADRRDFQSWYYSPAMTKYKKKVAQSVEDYHHTDSSFPMHQ